MIQIKRNNKVFFTLEDFGEGSKLSYQLMDHHYIILKFTTATPVYFEIGDSVEIPDFGYFELTSSYLPKHNDSGGYDYEMQMDAYYMSWKNKLCKYRPQHGANETSFKLTTTVGVHMNVILGNLKALGLTYNGKDFSVDYTTYNNKAFDVQKRFLIEYGSISILDALNAICSEDALNCEWWIDGSIIYLGYCEMEGQTTFEQDVNVLSMSYSESKSAHITRLYAFGSDRNIPKGYFTGADADVTTDGVATDYLMLPNKKVDSDGFYAKDGYLENVNVVKNDKQAIEGVVMFEEEYPKVESVVSSIKTYDSTVDNDDGTKTTQTFWQVTATDSFATNFEASWIKSNLTLGIKFTSGALMGMEFEVSFKVIDKANYFEIVANDTYGRTLPDGVMCPKVGDKFFLYNWDATKITYTDLIPAAQLSLFDRAKQYYQKTMISNSNFTCTMDGDKFYNDGTYDYHPIGEQVKLINDMFAQVDADGKHYRNSRIIGMEIPLDIPYDHPQYTVGEKAATSRLGKLEDKVDSITVNGMQIGGTGSGNGGVYVIGLNDSTPASDSNVYSARRSRMEFVSRLQDNTAKGTITFEKVQKLLGGLLVGENFSFDKEGNIIAHSIASENANEAGHKGFSIIQTDPNTGKYKLNIDELLAFSKATIMKQAKIGDKFVFDVERDFRFDAEGNIIAHSISSDGASEENGKGFTILQKDPLTNTYKLCIDEVIAYTVATVGKLFVNGNSRFGGELSSKQFISGFLGGLGWGIYNTPVTNAAGVQENKWTGEFDNVIVRGSLRVFEMIISQLLGENDNRIFTGMMEVDHYDAESGRVYLNTQDGKLYNPFRRNDIIMVQQFNGMPNSSNDYYVTKNYELLITDAGCGSLEDGDKRLDWVTFTNFTSSMEGATAESLIKKKDTFVRVDNLSDSQRKGIIQLMTVGANTPYMDIIYGLKTDPNNALKGRLGNLKGIVHPILGELSGFGEFLNNLYAVGDFIIQRTGESVDSKLQVLENMFSSRFSQTSYELTNSDNYLENGQFLEQVRDDEDTIISCWAVDTTDESMFWADALGNPFMVNGLLSVSGNRKVSIDKMDGRQVLRLQNCGVKQLNAHIRQPGTHKEYQQPSGSTGDNGLKKPATGSTDVQDRLYISIRIFAKTAGTLTVGFEGCSSVSGKSNTLTAQNVAVPYSGDWTNIPLEGVWNGTGNFVLRYTGDCYIAIASITDKPLSEFSKSVSTQIKQTATNIQLLGENINKVNGKTTQLGLDLDAEKKSIRLYVDETDKANRTFTTSGIEASVGKVQAWVKNLDYATNTTVNSKVEILSGRITSTVSKVNANSTSITNIQQDIDTITQTVGQAATKKQLKENVATLNRAIDSARSHADDVGTGIRNDYASTITLVKQSSSSWSVAAGGFDSNGKLKSSAGAVLNTDFAGLFVSQVNEKGLVNKGQMNIAISNGISTATIQADQINLTGHTMAFTGDQITITTDNFKLDKSGNMWCQNGTFSGMVSGVHGSFKNLDCVDSNGNVVGSIKFGSDGRLWFSGDMYHQGYDNAKKRNYRFYAADILCRGMFGHRQKTVAYVFNTYMAIYTNDSDDVDHYVMISLESGTESGKTYNKIHLYGFADYGDASGFAIDVVVINSSSDFYYVFEGMGNGKEWRVINGNDKQTIHFADIGGWHELKGGESLSCVYVVPRLLAPTPSGLGAGVFWSGTADLNWS